MAQPSVLVVDDSEAILAFARAVLASAYTVATARNGREGLESIRQARPDLVVLDLSMPEMDGEEVLARLQGDPELSTLPVIIMSSEEARARACVGRGAQACLIKPVAAGDLSTLVGTTLEEARARVVRRGMAVLPLAIGKIQLAVPLADVRHVLLQVATSRLPGGPTYLSAFFELHGEAVCVLDLAARFGVEHTTPIVDRMLVVLEYERVKLALCVDRVHDPELVLPGDVQSVLPASVSNDLRGALKGVVRTAHGTMPVLHAPSLLSRGLVASLDDLVRSGMTS
jgi:CheY-like chemotaxis protein